MRKKTEAQQKGFAVLESFLIMVIIVVVSGVGWYAIHTKHQTDRILAQADKISQNTPISKKSTKNTQSSIPFNQKYLIVNELGVKISLSSSILDAYYIIDDASKPPNQVALSIESLKNTQCKAEGWPLALLFRYTDLDRDPVNNKLLTTEYGTKYKVGHFYFMIVSGYATEQDKGGSCMSTQADQEKANIAAKAFVDTLSTLQPSQ